MWFTELIDLMFEFVKKNKLEVIAKKKKNKKELAPDWKSVDKTV